LTFWLLKASGSEDVLAFKLHFFVNNFDVYLSVFARHTINKITIKDNFEAATMQCKAIESEHTFSKVLKFLLFGLMVQVE